ncbi:MAG: GNAT family N-acetyltransferase, partial [Pseudomonadota bacterium]
PLHLHESVTEGGVLKTIDHIVRGVIVVQNTLLVAQQRGASNTFLPGGHIETGEPATIALVREFSEEMGINDVRVGAFLGAVEHAWPDESPQNYQINLVFEVQSLVLDAMAIRGEPPTSREAHLQFFWVPLDELSRHNLLPPPMAHLVDERSSDKVQWLSTMMTQRVLSDGDLRLRRVDVEEYVASASSWYRDAEVLDLSEAGAPPFDEAQIEQMFLSTSEKGEVFLVEVREEDQWLPIGDAALLVDATPIVIGADEYRGRGYGTRVLRLLIARAGAHGRTHLMVSGILTRNVRSLALYQNAGFERAGTHRDERGEEMIEMRLDLLDRQSHNARE